MTGAPQGDLRRRLATAVVLIPLFLAGVLLGGPWFMAGIMALAAVGAWEFFRMAEGKGLRPRTAAGIGLAAAFVPALAVASREPALLPALLTAALFGVGVAQLLDRRVEGSMAAVSVTVAGAAWIGLFLGHLVLLREIPRALPGMPYRYGALFVMVPIALTWANDTAAYFVGRRWGRRKLLPRVSPGKSVEGAVGALVATTLLAFPVLAAANRWVGLFDWLDMLAVGAILGLVAPLGDLIESAYKRDAGVKDSSALIPGHGGVLDRFDSLFVTAPAFYYYVTWAVL